LALILLAEVLQAVLAGDQGTGLADKAVARRVVLPSAVTVIRTAWSGILSICTISSRNSSTDGGSTEAHRRCTRYRCATIDATAIDAGTGYAAAIDAGASNASVMNAAASNGSAASSIGEGVSCNSHNTRDADDQGCRK
jgi:hypothetical protein